MSVCLVCGTEFQASRKDELYCSRACQQKAYRHRQASDITARIGGLMVPVLAADIVIGAYGVLGTARLMVPRGAIKGDFARGDFGTVEVQVHAAGIAVFGGDIETVTRAEDCIEIEAHGFEGRLDEVRLIAGNFQTLEQVAREAARLTALSMLGAPRDQRPFTLQSDAGAPGSLRADVPEPASRILLTASRELGWDFSVSPAGELRLAPPAAADPRLLTDVRGLRVTTRARGPAVVIVRSFQGARRFSSAALTGVEAGGPVYVCHAASLSPAAVEQLAWRLTREIAAGTVEVAGEVDGDASLVPGLPVRVNDVEGHLTRVQHTYAAEKHVTRFTALHLPPHPAITGAIGGHRA